MADAVSYRPNDFVALMILGVLPCMTLGLIIGGIAIERESPGHGGTVMIGSSALPAFFMFMSIRGWFSIHADAEALSIVGFLGLWRARMPVLAVRPADLRRLAGPT